MEEPRDPTPNPADGPRATTPAQLIAGLKRHWGLFVAIVVPVVTLATLVIPLIADANQRLTSAHTLEVGTNTSAPVGASHSSPSAAADGATTSLASSLSARELEGELVTDMLPNANWREPVDAPWDTFPINAGDNINTCTDTQVAWLAKYGRRDIADVWNGYMTLSNTATDGSAMSVRNIHSVGTFVQPKSPEVEVYCAYGIGGFSSIIPLTQDLGTKDPAVYADNDSGGQQGTPATLNITPGQYVQIWVDFARGKHITDDFSGDLVGDVVVGDTTTSTVLFKGFTREGAPTITTTSLTIYGNYVSCGKSFDACSIDQFLSQVKADPGYKG